MASRTKVRTWMPDEEVDLAIGEKGIEAEEPITVGQLFKSTKKRFPDIPALKYKEDGKWKSFTYAEYYEECIKAAKSFLKLGLEPNHAVAILGFNSPEWVISTLGTIFAGGLPAGIYETYNYKNCHFVAHDCQANIIVVANEEQADKILKFRDGLKFPHLKAVVQYKGKLSKNYHTQEYRTVRIYEWDEFLKLGNEIDTNVVEKKITSQKPNKCALLVYTPGTAGDPKGVMLSHDNLTFTAKSLERTYGEMVHGQERGVSYLPLSSIAAQMTDIYLPLSVGATVYFAQRDALNGSLVQTLREVQPTFFFGVPSDSLQADTNQLFFEKVREELGFQHCKIFAVGSAPMCRNIHDHFYSIEIPLREVYGLSESSGPHTLSPIPQKGVNVGSCGKPIMGVKQKIVIDEKGHHEICLYGRHVFMGYLNDKKKTVGCLTDSNTETLDTWIDSEGWLHSGDIGKIEGDFLYITGRIKELIITSSGDNIPPVPIENRIKDEIPFLSNVMVVGDKRQFLTCLMTLKCTMDSGKPQDTLTPEVQRLIKACGSHNTKVSEIVAENDQAVSTAIWEGVERANKCATSQQYWVQKWTLLSTDFSIPGGELGPTLKVKRHVVHRKYKKEIESMYNTLTLENIDHMLTEVLDWYTLGKKLDLPVHSLHEIHIDYSTYGTDRQRQEMISNWLRHDTEASWIKLASALKEMGNNRVATKIWKQYVPGYIVNPPKIIQHPKDQSVATGENIDFTIEATGDKLLFQWKKNDDDLSDDDKYRGSKTHTLIILKVKESDEAHYRCFVKNDEGELLSDPALLTIIDPPKITRHPASKSLETGASTTFTVEASGDDLQFQWKKDCMDLSDDDRYHKTDTNTLHIARVMKDDNKARYQCLVKNDVRKDLSKEAVLTVIDPPKISQHPESKSVATGTSASFTVEASGDDLQFQWKKDDKDLHDDSKYRGTKTHTLHIKDVETNDKGSYQCLVKNDRREQLSERADLAITPLSGMLQPTGHPGTQYCGENQQTFSSSQPLQQETHLTLQNIDKKLKEVLDWHTLGMKLGLPVYKLEEIRIDYSAYGTGRQRQEMITTWLDYDTKASWDKLANALKEMGKPVVATKIYTYVPGYRDEVNFPSSAVNRANQLGVQFIDPVETIFCDTHGCDYYNRRHDVGVTIPEGAILPSDGMIKIEFGVAMYGPFRLADERSVRRVSPVVWLCVQQDGFSGFQKDVEITIPHFLDFSTEDAHKYLRFLKADHQLDLLTIDGKLEYQLKPADGKTVFDHAAYGKHFTRHFCSVCLATSVVHNERTRYYLGGEILPKGQDWQIIFFVCYFLKSCVRTAKKQLNKDSKWIYPTAFMFDDGKELRMRLPNEVSGWLLAMESSHKISAAEVDFTRIKEELQLREATRLYPPRFVVTIQGSGTVKDSTLAFKFEGATEEIVKEVIFTKAISSPTSSLTPSIVYSRTGLERVNGTRVLGEDDLWDVRSAVADLAGRWKDLGVCLGIHLSDLDSIPFSSPSECLREMLALWLRQSYNVERFGKPTWRRLVEAVEDKVGGNNPALAQAIAREHHVTAGHNWTLLICILTLLLLVTMIGMWWLLPSVAVDCGTLPNPANGRVSHTTRTTVGQTATYSCNPGYNLVGGSTRTCQAAGVWSGSAPICQYQPHQPAGILQLNRDNRPTLDALRHFPVKDHFIDIAKKIATDYKLFGTQLLKDSDGNEVRIIEMKHGDPVDITVEILEQWLQGKGKMPATWQTLIKCLRDTGLNVLADIIESSLSENNGGKDSDRVHLKEL